jgi:Leucine-rich repeat (LRR) protein
MESIPSPTPPTAVRQGIGIISNAGTQRYLLEAESTTGFVAWKIADGTILISEAMQVSLAASESIEFWPCVGYQDTSRAGRIMSFDCHGNAVTNLDVRGLTGLEYLDCCFNQLRELTLDGLTKLEALDVDNNQLANLNVRGLQALRVLNCAHNRLRNFDVSGLASLRILDCSDNPIQVFRHDGCTSLQDVKGERNPQ